MKKLIGMFTGLAVLGVAGTVLAQDLDPNNLGELLPALVEAVKGGEWNIVVSLALMILVFLATKVPFINNWMSKPVKRWVAPIAAVALSIATTVLTTGDWVTALLTGLVTGTAAVGLWETVGKQFLGSSESSDA